MLFRSGDKDLFVSEYIYRCILTNDREKTEEEVVLFYNQRGERERIFDHMDNDFGWKRLSKSFMNENAVFMLLTAMACNSIYSSSTRPKCRSSASRQHQESKGLSSGSYPFLPNGLSRQEGTSLTYIRAADRITWYMTIAEQKKFFGGAKLG